MSIKKHFLTGLVILLPLVITVAVVGFFINFLTAPFLDIVTTFLKKAHLIEDGTLFSSDNQMIKYLSKILILVALFFVIVGLGMITRWFLFRALFNLGDRILHKIPIFNTVYKATQEITKTVFKSDAMIFKQVVIVPFLHKETYAIGLITQDSPSMLNQLLGTDIVTVLIPTTPNPTTGFLILFKRSDLIYIDMKPEEALKYIVSCGVLLPDREILKKPIGGEVL